MKLAQIKNQNLSKIGKAAEKNGGHIRIENEPYMPLSAEWIGHVTLAGFNLPALAVSHVGIQNGDIMRDPEICFARVFRDGVEYFIAYEYRNDYLGILRTHASGYTSNRINQRDAAEFSMQWMKNLQDQGFIDLLNPERQSR